MLKHYQIDLKNLSQATTYKYDYLLDNDFFDLIEGQEVRKGNVNVALSIVRISTAFELDFRINGVITVICDRCLDNLEISIETTNKLFVTFGDSNTEISDERIVVSEEEGFINIAWLLYEFVALAIPIKNVHINNDCNEIMSLILREHCVEEFIEDDGISESENSSRKSDPRWDKLRYLIENN